MLNYFSIKNSYTFKSPYKPPNNKKRFKNNNNSEKLSDCHPVLLSDILVFKIE